MTEAYKHTLATTLTQSAHTFHNITFYLHMASFAGFSKISVNIIAKVKEALALYFAPANREFGVLPTYQEIVEIAVGSDTRIRWFDLGSPGTQNYGIIWQNCDIDCFNAISFARFVDPGSTSQNIRIHPECLVR